MLSLKQVQDQCLIYQGARECRYLAHGFSTNDCLCLKKLGGKKKAIDAQVTKFLDQSKKNGQDPKQMGRPLGNNCSGYLPLKTVQQGYDVP